jgi:hypothetical protein
MSEQDETGRTLATYARLVPIEIRRIAGPYASRQWSVLLALQNVLKRHRLGGKHP